MREQQSTMASKSVFLCAEYRCERRGKGHATVGFNKGNGSTSASRASITTRIRRSKDTHMLFTATPICKSGLLECTILEIMKYMRGYHRLHLCTHNAISPKCLHLHHGPVSSARTGASHLPQRICCTEAEFSPLSSVSTVYPWPPP